MLRFRHLILCSTAFGMLVFGGAAAAQEETPTDLEGIVVTGGLEESLPGELARIGNRLEVIDAETLEAGGFNDAAEALSRVAPGLYLAPRNGPFSYLDAALQGSRQSEILYLVDGVRISNRLYNTTPPLDTIPAHMAERIEVLEGGQGLFYGTQAVAGVINIVTRSFTTERDGAVSVSGHTNDGWNASVYLRDELPGGTQYVAFLSHDEADGFQPFPSVDYQPSVTDRARGYRLTSAGLKLAHDLSDDLRLSASYQHNDGVVDFLRPFGGVRSATNDRDEEIATAKLDWTASERLELFLKAYWHDWKSHYNEVVNGPGGAPEVASADEFWGFWDYGLNGVAKFTVQPGVQLFAGYDFQRYWGRDDVLLIADQKESTQAVFGQLRLTPELLGQANLAIGVRHNMPDPGQEGTIWNVSGQFDLTDSLFIRATGGTAFRLPDAYELFVNDPSAGEVGNPDLRPERAKTLNASIGGRPNDGAVQWELIGFWRTTEDLIDIVDHESLPGFSTFRNVDGEVEVRGAEAVIRAKISPAVNLGASYTHVRARADDSHLQFARIPTDIAKVSLDYRPTDAPYGISVFANWVGDVFENLPSGLGRVNYGDYAVVDLNAFYTFGPQDAHRLALRVENLFDEAYATAVRRGFTDADDEPYAFRHLGVPRTAHLRYSYDF